ncbi:MAG TPA: tetratricopeptide repeat protein [Candidatus Baltobacteraceae bacterium]|nr:tetratricopeptide repeat protein [Candidatus Baltobacteraceae bacterium]
MRILCRRLTCFVALTCFLVLGAGCSKSAKAKRLLASADRDYQAMQYDAAELNYRGVLRLSYLNPAAVRQLGLLYCAEGRPGQAAVYLKKSLEQDPNNVEVQVRMAQTLATLGNPKGAFTLASRVLEKEPANEDALLLCVDLARSTTNLNIVRERIEKLQAAGPDAPSFHAALAWVDLRLQQPSDAEAEIQKALNLDPKLASAYLAKAALAIARKDQSAASDCLKTAAELSPLRSTARIKYADFRYNAGSPGDAEHILEEVTGQAPDYIPAWINLMHLFFAERDYDRCSEVIAKILARDSVNFEALMQSGNLSLAKRDGTNALATFRQLDLVHKAPVVKYRMALAYLMNGDRADAVGSLTDALTLDHDYAAATLLLAELDIRGGNSTAAVNLLLPLLKKEPQEARGHVLLATAYLAERQPDSALDVYRQMASVFPKNPEVPRLMGVVYELEGNTASARDAFEQSLALEPDYVPTLERITALDLDAKRYADAEQRLGSVITANPKQAGPWLLRGKVYWAAGQTNQAESDMSKAIELDPDLPGGYLALAHLYLDTHQDQQALARLNALASKTNDTTAMLEIGEIHQEAQQMDEARDAYLKLLSFQPDFAPALNNLAYIYAEHYRTYDKAAEMAERARKARPDDPYVADTLAWILYKQGQYSRALDLIQESLEKEPNNAEVQMHLGMTYYMMEEEDLARVHLQQALSSGADYPGKEDARHCLALLAIDPAAATPAEIELLEQQLRDNPRDPVPLNRLAAIDELHGEVEKAVDAYQKLIAQNPQDWKAMIKLGRLYSMSLHQTRKALDLAKAAHEIAPNDPRAAAMLGQLVYASGDYQWALSLLEDSAPRLPNQPSAQYDLAMAYYAVGRLSSADSAMEDAVNAGAALANLDQAKQFLAFRAAAKDPSGAAISVEKVQAVLDKDPHYLPAMALSGLLSERQGDYAKATKTYEQILAEYPQFTPAMRQLTFIYAQPSGDQAKAYDLGEKARAAFPDDLELARTVGILAYRKAEYRESVRLLRDSARKFDNDGELSYYLGMDYYQLKQGADSKKSLQRALALNVPPPMAGEAKRVLGELK